MKNKLNRPGRTLAPKACMLLLAYALPMLLSPPVAVAGVTDLSNIPLVNTTSAIVLPNILLLLDNSGSMQWFHMPDDAQHTTSNYSGEPQRYWPSWHCNALAYNPNITYTVPVSLGTNTYAPASFTAAKKNGFDSSSGSTNLTGRIYYEYNGAEPDLNFTYNTDGTNKPLTFYNECNSTPPVTTTTTITTPGTPAIPGTPAVPAIPGTAKITISNLSNTSYTVRSIKVNGVDIMVGSTSASNKNTLAAQVAPKISLQGFTATALANDNNIIISTYDPLMKGFSPIVSLWKNNLTENNTKISTTPFTKAVAAVAAIPGTPATPDVVTTSTSTTSGSGIGVGKFIPITVTSGDQNYANWYSYYRSRMLMAKSSIGLAFQNVRGYPLDSKTDTTTDTEYFHARVGLSSINTSGTTQVPIANFNSSINTGSDTVLGDNNNGQRVAFYDALYSADGSSGTPLRVALSTAGRLYAGEFTNDPVQYSCQKNFAILTTDGYWNGNGGIKLGGSIALDDDQDGAAINPPASKSKPNPSYDLGHWKGTLADVAYYYYNTDLRTSGDKAPNNVPPAVADLTSLTEDVAPWQHMSTYTIGLGVDGTIPYEKDYKTSLAGKFYDISVGGKWPEPGANKIENIDDLWHAAVNGRGTYFSAKDPKALKDSIESALGSVSASAGSGSSAGSSSLSPTSLDDKAFIGSYNTADWSGDLKAYKVTDLTTGALSDTPTWSATEQLKAKIPGVGKADTRTIYAGKSTTATLLDASSIDSKYLTHTFSQSAPWDTAKTTANTPANLLNYLRGNQDYEERSGATQALYRTRGSNVGDIIASQPVSVAKAPYTFADDGYAKFKAAMNGRAGTVYVGSNDGMLHAFDNATGNENWAYIPPMVYPNLWSLADRTYPKKHVNFVNGPLSVSDANIGGWKTVLISAMGLGGRGYFAFDITSPTTPQGFRTRMT